MAQRPQIETLAERRQRLMADSDRLRREIAEDLTHLQPLCGWVDRGYSMTRSVLTVWPIVAGAAHFLGAKKRRGRVGTITRVLSSYRVGRKAYGVWRAISSSLPRQRPSPQPEPHPVP
jgi:hypothetical protein